MVPGIYIPDIAEYNISVVFFQKLLSGMLVSDQC